jgi:hypothetical protein
MATKETRRQPLSPDLDEIWGFVKSRFLVIATREFIVFLDEQLCVDWKTTNEFDDANAHSHASISRILNRAAAVEAAEWDSSDEQKTTHFKRQIGEAIARAFEGSFEQADEMLLAAEQYRQAELLKRAQAIGEQVKVKDRWFHCHQKWTVVHYGIGGAAIFFSSLAASKAETLGLGAAVTAWCSWLTVLFTAFLTFLSAERKSNKYARAWSVLNNQITRYNSDHRCQLDDVLEAYQQGESIIFETDGASPKGPRRARS